VIYALLYWPCYVLFRLLARLRVEGGHHMPRHGGVLLVCNHLSAWDPPLVAVSFRRPLHFMTKAELVNSPVVGWMLRQLNAFAVRRGEPDRMALRRTEEMLARGLVVAIFPEGHRSRTAGLQQPQGGVAFLARRAAVPILPVAIYGSERINLRALWRRPVVRVVVGEPFRLEDAGPAGRRQAADVIMTRIAALLPREYRGAYGDAAPAAPADA
jgi:1-acyl-sn-glycerol-3-phosphate acyltransferase